MALIDRLSLHADELVACQLYAPLTVFASPLPLLLQLLPLHVSIHCNTM